MTFQHVSIHALQVVLLIGLAGISARLCRLPGGSARLIYWRAVLASCFFLPLWPIGVGEADTISAPLLGLPLEAVRLESTTSPPGSWMDVGLLFLCLGVVVRAGWLAVGLRQLARLRRQSTPALLDADLCALCANLAPSADIRVHPSVGQPVTFGLRRPLVLLPQRLLSLAPDARRAVVCHELLHVKRRDWMWTLADEAVRTLFWFNPAVRWALSQIELGREEVVDRLVVDRTGARAAYMTALMTFGEARVPRPAAAFGQRHLAQRIRRLSSTRQMSSGALRLVSAVLAVMLVVWSAVVASALPLGATPAPADAQVARQGATPWRPFPVTRADAVYPDSGNAQPLSALVTVTATIAPDGRVTHVQPRRCGIGGGADLDSRSSCETSAGRAFIAAAAAAARQWTFAPSTAETDAEIAFSFRADQHPGPTKGVLLSPAMVTSGVPVRSGDRGTGPVVLVEKKPDYPPEVFRSGVQGNVITEILIGADGAVRDARIVRGLPGLDEASLDAARQWRFEPAREDGQPVEVFVFLEFRFNVK